MAHDHAAVSIERGRSDGIVEGVCLGEPLIEFNRPKEGDGRTWLQGFGGDSQNVAIAAISSGVATRPSGMSASSPGPPRLAR